MRFPIRFVASSKKAKLLDASQPLEYIELPKFEISNDQQNHHTTGDSFHYNSKSFGSNSLECSQTLNCVAGATLSLQVTAATTTGTSTKQEKPAEITKSTDVALVHYVDSEGLLQAVAKPTKVSTGQRIKATVASYADSARRIIFRRTDSETDKESENTGLKIAESPNSAETRVGVQYEAQSETGSRSSVSAQTQMTHKSSRASKIFHYQNKRRKSGISRKQKILAAKKRHAKRRATRSGRVLLPIPKNLEAWEDIKQNVKQPNDKGYDIKFDYNKILKPSFVENWLDANVNPIVSALSLSAEQLGNGQIEYAKDFEKEAEEPARICANCKQDPTGASGLGNCDTCYYFLKSERKEFLKYGDAKNIKREFDAHAACPFMSSDVEDSFVSTGDSILGICLMPILGIWEKMDRKIFHAKTRFRSFKESVPTWSRNVRAAANKGYGWRSVRPAKCGPQPKTWGDLLPQDFSPRYDQFWPQDYSPAQYYEINVNDSARPKDAVFVKVSYPDPEPESPHVSWYSLHCALKRCWLDRKQKQRILESALAKNLKKSGVNTEEKEKVKSRVTFANDVCEPKKANHFPTMESVTQTSRSDHRAGSNSEINDFLEFSMGAEATGNPNKVWASAESIHNSASVTAAGSNDSTDIPGFEKVASEDILHSATEEASSAVSHSTESLKKANGLKVLCLLNDIHVENIESVEVSIQQSDSELIPVTEKSFESSPVVPILPSSSQVNFEGQESPIEPAPESTGLLKDVVQQIDEMLESLGHSPKQYSPADLKLSDSSLCDISDQSNSIIDFNQNKFVADGFCNIANFESDNESSIEEFYTRESAGHSSQQCNQSLTEDLITEILSRYKQGKFDQDNDPKAAAETLTALLHKVFKGACDFSEDFIRTEKVSSSAYSDHDDICRFTLLSDSEDELVSLEIPSADEVKSEYDESLIVFERSRPNLKELKLVRKKFTSERSEIVKYSNTTYGVVEECAHEASSVENIHSTLKKFKLSSHIPEYLSFTKVKPLRFLGLVVEPPIPKVSSPVKVCLHPVIIQMTKQSPKVLGEMKCRRPIDSRMKEALCDSHISSALAQQHHFMSHCGSSSIDVVSEKVKSKIRESSVASPTENISERADEDLSSLNFLASLKDDKTLSPEITVKIGEVFLSEQVEEKSEFYEVVSTNPDILFEICKIGEIPDPIEMDNHIEIPEKLILDCEVDSASEFGGSMDEEMNRAAFFDYMEDPLTISDESLWFALSLDADFDRKIVHKNNCDDDELDIVKSARESLLRSSGLSEIDAANGDDFQVDYASKRQTKVQFKDEDKLCEIEMVDRNLAPKTIKCCASNIKVPERSIYRKPQTQELGRFISAKEFCQPRTEEGRKESEIEMQTKIDECREVFSNLTGKHETEQLQDMFDQFLESFKFSRENFAEIATVQILQYTNWLAHIKRTISGAFALVSGAGSRFILLLIFIDQTGKSEWSLVRAEKDIQNIMDLLSNVDSMLEQVQDAILQLRLEFPEYVGAMAEIAETALRSRKELLEIYSMFCLSSLKDTTDISIVHYCTGYENFVQKTKFLANEESSDYEINFATALNDLQRSHYIVSETKSNLEKRLNLISNKLSDFRLELTPKRLSQETAVSMKSSPSELSLGGQTLAGGSSEDIVGPGDGQISDSTMKNMPENLNETKQESKQSKAKFEVPKWMRFKGFGKKV